MEEAEALDLMEHYADELGLTWFGVEIDARTGRKRELEPLLSGDGGRAAAEKLIEIHRHIERRERRSEKYVPPSRRYALGVKGSITLSR